MNIPAFDPDRLAALRAGLVERAATSPRSGLPVWAGITTFAVAGALVGGAVSAAATGIIPTAASSPQASPFTIGSAAGLKGVPALPGTQPGMPIVSLLGGGTSLQAESSMTVRLAGIPATATDVRVGVTCVSAGRLAWGTNPTGNNPSVTCAAADVGTVSASTFFDFSTKGADALYLDPTGTWIVSYQYLRKVETAWGVNRHGQTYGVEKAGAGSPDLVAVVGQPPMARMSRGMLSRLHSNGRAGTNRPPPPTPSSSRTRSPSSTPTASRCPSTNPTEPPASAPSRSVAIRGWDLESASAAVDLSEAEHDGGHEQRRPLDSRTDRRDHREGGWLARRDARAGPPGDRERRPRHRRGDQVAQAVTARRRGDLDARRQHLHGRRAQGRGAPDFPQGHPHRRPRQASSTPASTAAGCGRSTTSRGPRSTTPRSRS